MDELKIEPFRFEYTRPSYDWYTLHVVEIKPDDFYYFELELRYGNTWWLIGKNPPDFASNDFTWDKRCLGRLTRHDAARFVVWARDAAFDIRNKLVGISAISGNLDVVEEIEALLIEVREANDGNKTDL